MDADAYAELDEILADLVPDPDDAAHATWERAMAAYDIAFVLANTDDHAGAVARVAPAAALFRSIEAFEEALMAELRHGEILIASGDPAPGAEMLARVLGALPADHRARRETAWWLARAWDALGEGSRAAALRREFDLDEA
jgi:hypothetical protein